MRKGNNISILNLSYVREVDNNNLLSGELDNLSNLTQSTSPQSSPSKERRNKRIILARKGIIMIIYFLSLLFPFSSHATCTPTPDCASIGYTETSCETISLKCPFDQTKLYCFPCDSAYQYTCSNTNEYGNGNSCNNKYKSCCNTDCVVGNIYYSDGTCNSCLDANKTPIGIVVKDNELIMNLVYSSQFWSPTQANIPELPDYSDKLSAQTDFAGKSNTAKIVAYYGKNADASNNAGLYCYNYAPLGLENSKGNWYLPSAGEIYTYVSPNSDKITKVRNILDIEEPFHWFWSSTEYNYYNVWCVSATSGYMGGSTSKKESSVPVITSCFLSIN